MAKTHTVNFSDLFPFCSYRLISNPEISCKEGNKPTREGRNKVRKRLMKGKIKKGRKKQEKNK
jgi:hypothetical protein